MIINICIVFIEREFDSFFMVLVKYFWFVCSVIGSV